MKHCRRCDQDKPPDAFNRRSASPDGRCPECRDCQRARRQEHYAKNREQENARDRAYYAADPERAKQRWSEYAEQRWGEARRERKAAKAAHLAASTKTCPRCQRERVKAEFYIDKRRPDGLYAWCKTCFREHGRTTYDPAKDRARRQAKADDPEYRARVYARVKKWRAKNPERYGLLARGYASQRRTTPSGRPVDLAAVLAEHGMWCYLCETDIATVDGLHFDHVTPLSRGGVHEEGNLRPTHARCNLRKHAKLPDEMSA